MLCKTCQLDLEHSDGGAGLQCARRLVYQDAVKTWHTRRRYLERQDTDPRTDDELFTALYREAHLHDLTMHTAHQYSIFSNIFFAHASRIEDGIFPGSRDTSSGMLQTACLARSACAGPENVVLQGWTGCSGAAAGSIVVGRRQGWVWWIDDAAGRRV